MTETPAGWRSGEWRPRDGFSGENTTEWARIAFRHHPYCWFCGRRLVHDGEPEHYPPDWSTYDHLVSRLNGDVPSPLKDALGGVLACYECNAERGIYSWHLTMAGLRRNGAPYPQKPTRDGHVWKYEADPWSSLQMQCERCGIIARRLHPGIRGRPGPDDVGGRWLWRGARDSGWQGLRFIRRCEEEQKRVA